MPASAQAEQAHAGKARIGYYIYGIVPSDVEVTQDARGIGDPPSDVEVIPHREIAALVSPIAIARPIGQPADLTAHEHLLDGAAAKVPVLPMRFGAVVTSQDAVVEELLAP